MEKELYEKLNQLDRIEYQQRSSSWLFFFGCGTFVFAYLVAFISLRTINVANTSKLDTLIFSAIIVILGIIIFILCVVYDSIKQNKLDKQFMKKLEIKSKK